MLHSSTHQRVKLIKNPINQSKSFILINKMHDTSWDVNFLKGLSQNDKSMIHMYKMLHSGEQK